VCVCVCVCVCVLTLIVSILYCHLSPAVSFPSHKTFSTIRSFKIPQNAGNEVLMLGPDVSGDDEPQVSR